MDTSEYPSLAQIARLNAKLAVHCSRIDAVIDGQLDAVERLFRAAADHDWDAVSRASQQLAAQQVDGENSTVVQTAWRVFTSLRRDPTGSGSAGKLAALLSACRAEMARRQLR